MWCLSVRSAVSRLWRPLPVLLLKSTARRQSSTFNQKKGTIPNEIHFKRINTNNMFLQFVYEQYVKIWFWLTLKIPWMRGEIPRHCRYFDSPTATIKRWMSLDLAKGNHKTIPMGKRVGVQCRWSRGSHVPVRLITLQLNFHNSSTITFVP